MKSRALVLDGVFDRGKPVLEPRGRPATVEDAAKMAAAGKLNPSTTGGSAVVYSEVILFPPAGEFHGRHY